ALDFGKLPRWQYFLWISEQMFIMLSTVVCFALVRFGDADFVIIGGGSACSKGRSAKTSSTLNIALLIL
ncbi:unnamed protein product, partial [Amoebophrya sp. A25]